MLVLGAKLIILLTHGRNVCLPTGVESLEVPRIGHSRSAEPVRSDLIRSGPNSLANSIHPTPQYPIPHL
jgi:hypothetical protein